MPSVTMPQSDDRARGYAEGYAEGFKAGVLEWMQKILVYMIERKHGSVSEADQTLVDSISGVPRLLDVACAMMSGASLDEVRRLLQANGETR